jgi:hypothetical protein
VSDDIKNPRFVYDEGELKDDYAWEGLADFLGVKSIDHKKNSSVSSVELKQIYHMRRILKE